MKAFSIFEQKLIKSGLADSNNPPLMGFLDAEKTWNQTDKNHRLYSAILDNHRINSILSFVPAEPYKSIIMYLSEISGTCIYPDDCETRTFLHDLPVISSPEYDALSYALKKRKGVIVKNGEIVTTGTVSIEQAFVSASSICFACFIKFYSDYLKALKLNTVTPKFRNLFNRLRQHQENEHINEEILQQNIFESEETVLKAINEAGRATVNNRLVDSYFGNISALYNNTLYISQTGSSMDNLPHHIDPCKLDGSSCAGITASSELPAHMETVRRTKAQTILHGHPRFSVIMSMDCDNRDCPKNVQCHLNCPVKREVCGVPIVPGEVGTGKYGLCNTVPAALKEGDAVIVYGHGVFATGEKDFNKPYNTLVTIENNCRKEYFSRIDAIEN
jgi:ribulose-5-phosphate 4-epimerase/fuculose-1-phosphate aldolase